jgi:hypothetical protein
LGEAKGESKGDEKEPQRAVSSARAWAHQQQKSGAEKDAPWGHEMDARWDEVSG